MGPATQLQEPASVKKGVFARILKWGLIGAMAMAVFVVLFYAEENRRGKKAWETAQRHLAARGIELDWRKLAPGPVGDADNFAATPFLAALFDYEPGTHTPRDLQAYNRVAGFAQTEPPYAEQRGPGEPPPPVIRGERIDLASALTRLRKAQRPAGAVVETNQASRTEVAGSLLEALEQYRPVLEELRGASQRRQARFNLNYAEDYPWRVSQPHLPVLKRVSRVLAWRASAELAVGNSRAAADDAALELSLASALQEEPLLSSLTARDFILLNARQIIWEGLAAHQWSDGELRDFQLRLARFTLQDAQRLLMFERAADNAVFEFAHREPNVVRGWGLGPRLADKLRAFVLRHMPTGWMYLEQNSYQQAFDQFIAPTLELEAGRIRPGLVEQACHPSFPVLRHELIVGPVASNGRYLFMNEAMAQTGVDQTSIACALERYRLATGGLPEKLEALNTYLTGSLPFDVITGKPMTYKVTGDGQFTLYSVGWNEKDEGGKMVLNQQGNATDPTQGDWVWPTCRK